MKICLINNLYKPYARGGAERIVELSVEGLRAQGHEVVIISSKPYFSQKTRAKEEKHVYYLRSLYSSLEKLPKFVRLFWHITNLFDFFSARKILKIIKNERVDLAISHNLLGLSFVLPLLLDKTEIKHIHILHDIQLLHPSGLMFWSQENILDSFMAKIYQSICRFLFSNCKIVISPSKWLMDLHRERSFFLGAKQKVIKNPINIRNSANMQINNCDEVFKFLFVGQIEVHKGIELLLTAFKLLQTKYRGEVSLSVVGNGSKFDSLKKRYRCAEISFKGHQGRADVITQMMEHDCLIVPSLCYENSPTVIYEATAVSLPVIAARLGGISELLHDLGGVLFNPADADDLALKMEYLFNNREKFTSVLAQKKIQTYSLDKYINNILSTLV